MLLNFLICFFIILIIYQIFLAYFNNIEGLENQYQEYDDSNPNNVMILAQKNAGNIEVLRTQISSLLGLDKKVQDLSANYASLQGQVDNIMLEQKNYSEQMLPTETPEITGAV